MEGLYACGAFPVLLPVTGDGDMWLQAVQELDGFLFSGGVDIDARYFGEETLQCCGEISPARDKMELDLGSEQIQLLHFGPAHTSGDIVVFFPSRKLAFVGDLVFIGRDPLIHRIKGGTSAGLITTLQKLLKLDAERYIPGHGNIANKSDIEAELKMLQEKRDKVKTLVCGGAQRQN
jgi:glyoxylase-like metal-dependent hydrolase (beta-lactamase superfamily II)